MNSHVVRLLALTLLGFCSAAVHAQNPPAPTPGEEFIPPQLAEWIPWARHGLPDADAVPQYNQQGLRILFWPSRLKLDTAQTNAAFSFSVESFGKGWLPLPGQAGCWPEQVTINGQPAPVLERAGRPAVRLTAGRHTIGGTFNWLQPPQQIKLPPQIGLLALTINGQSQPFPSWDADGTLWLQRQSSLEAVDQDFLSLKIHSLLTDGIPLWFETRVELIVAGKSREEVFGSVLPAGWQLASVESPLPVAVDEAGLLKGQVRAGRWTIVLRAFRTAPTDTFAFPEGARPAVPDQTLAFQANSDFRQAEITGLPQIDAGQTQAPEEWRVLPLYRWDTQGAFKLAEQVRGPGQRGAANISITRTLWLDEDGRGLTFQDRLTAGKMREIRRLDVARDHQLGSVTSYGAPQLITANPDDGTAGFEVRGDTLDATANGRIAFTKTLSATGWKASADSVAATLHLPPGYRLFALFGADNTRGDWLTSWSLLDLFLLLLFTLAVRRMHGIAAAALAFAAFALAYHEPGAPRLVWLLLLIPTAIAAVLPPGRAQRFAVLFKWGTFMLLLIALTPFLGRQIQTVIYPQLERISHRGGDYTRQEAFPLSISSSPAQTDKWEFGASSESGARKFYYDTDNLKADPKAVIQTGPGVPNWSWRTVSFSLDGPVTVAQTIKPVFITPVVARLLGVARVLALTLLALLLMKERKRPLPQPPPIPARADEPPPGPAAASPAPVACLLVALLLSALPETARAQFPEQALLDELKTRLAETSDAFPGAADLASAALRVQGDAASLTLDYHAADRCAVPVPAPLAAWSIEAASFGGDQAAPLLRRDGLLWTLLPGAGLHTLTLRARVRDLNEWEWSFPIRPRRAGISAEGWTFSGWQPDGRTEDQILFYRVGRGEAAAVAAYDRPETRHALLVDRRIEMGLVWRVKTTAKRLSPPGRAIALRIPLLPGEKVVTPGRNVAAGVIEVHLAPGAGEVSWESELTPVNELVLAARADDSWSEQWRLAASPVWNVRFSGLSPVFEPSDGQLISFWQPWPGEQATLAVSRPVAVPGAVITVDNVKHELTPGRRQRTSTLTLQLRASLGEDFPIRLPADAGVTGLTHAGRNIPVRKEGDAVIVPLRPGAQDIQLSWNRPGDETTRTRVDEVALPVEAANISTVINPSGDRWVLTTRGPRLGPAVRFWPILVFAVFVAVVLARLPGTPLRLVEWILLAFGLTQAGVLGALVVVGWLFFVRWRGSAAFQQLDRVSYNLATVMLFLHTFVVIGVFFVLAAEGLLGSPDMYIIGNQSHPGHLAWYSPRCGGALPVPGYASVSVWWFRLAMLLWALWLASALVRWLRVMWRHSAAGGHFHANPNAKRKIGANPLKHMMQPPAQ
jgi:hypothetical protein